MTYASDGYVIAKGLIDSQSVEYVASHIHDIVGLQGSFSGSTFLDMQRLLQKDPQRYTSTLRLASQMVSVQLLFSMPAVLRRCFDLGVQMPVWQTGSVLHVVSDSLIVPGGYNGIGVHQDYSSTQASLNGIVAWIPLCDIDKGFYPLEVIPGSHKKGLLPNKEAGGHYYEVDQGAYNEKDFIKLEMKKGDVLFMSVFTVHRTCLEGRKGVRMAVSIRYEDAMEPTFIERGYPNMYRRVRV